MYLRMLCVHIVGESQQSMKLFDSWGVHIICELLGSWGTCMYTSMELFDS